MGKSENNSSRAAALPPSIVSLLTSAQLGSAQSLAAWYEAQVNAMSARKGKERQMKSRSRPSSSLQQSIANSSCIAKASQTPENASTNESGELKSFASRLYNASVTTYREISDDDIDLFKLNIVGDGRCLFRSVAVLLFRSYQVFKVTETQERDLADALRSETVKQLRAHRELLEECFVIEGDFCKYAQHMSQPTTFAGEPELFMLSKLVERPICVYVRLPHGGDYKRIQTYAQQFNGEPLRLLYEERTQHYHALVAFRKSETTFGPSLP